MNKNIQHPIPIDLMTSFNAVGIMISVTKIEVYISLLVLVLQPSVLAGSVSCLILLEVRWLLGVVVQRNKNLTIHPVFHPAMVLLWFQMG